MPVKFNVNTKIKIGGKEYSSPEEMPPDIRQRFEELLAAGKVKVNVNSSQITFNGKTYNSLDEMPEDDRRLYESVMSSIDKDHDGIPDSLQSGSGWTFPTSQTDFPGASFPSQTNPVQPKTSNRTLPASFLLMGFVLLLALIALAFVLASR